MAVSGQLHAPSALLLEEEHHASIEEEAGWASEPFCTPCSSDECLNPALNQNTILWFFNLKPCHYAN
jgi:hypothetical protein